MCCIDVERVYLLFIGFFFCLVDLIELVFRWEENFQKKEELLVGGK
jgi:hypothetical protein